MNGVSQHFPNEVFVPGQGTELARELLELTAQLGFSDQTVRVSEQGFMVPARVASVVFSGRAPDSELDRRQLRKRDSSGRYLSKKGGS